MVLGPLELVYGRNVEEFGAKALDCCKQRLVDISGRNVDDQNEEVNA